MSTCPLSHCSSVPGRVAGMSTCPLSHCLGVPGRAPGMSICPLSHCSGVPRRALDTIHAPDDSCVMFCLPVYDALETESASLRATIRTMGAVEMSLRNRIRDERQTRIKIERQLASVQESHRQGNERTFKKLKEFPGLTAYG
ncbi:hypothetical protein Tco_0317603 [Tanacetum coccineum]